MTNEKVKTLEQKILDEPSFDKVYCYFMDHFGDHRTFVEMGERVLAPQLLGLFAQVGQNLFKKEELTITQPTIIKVSKWKMLHGSMFIDDNLLCFFILKNVNRGMLSVCKLGSSMVHYGRITPQMLPDGTIPQDLFDDFQEIHAN